MKNKFDRKAWYKANQPRELARRKSWAKRHPERVKAKNKAWRLANPDKLKNIKLKQLYGITLNQFNVMLKTQKSKCLICRRAVKLVVDHCHKTGRVRGLLCSKCNMVFGWFEKHCKKILKYAE